MASGEFEVDSTHDAAAVEVFEETSEDDHEHGGQGECPCFCYDLDGLSVSCQNAGENSSESHEGECWPFEHFVTPNEFSVEVLDH